MASMFKLLVRELLISAMWLLFLSPECFEVCSLFHILYTHIPYALTSQLTWQWTGLMTNSIGQLERERLKRWTWRQNKELY